MTETKTEPVAIAAVDVSKRFGTVTALDHVSFDVRPGELFFLLGPSGCGKTTMLRILAGLETPDSGTITFNGRDILSLPPHRRGAPMVFQNYALWPHLSVNDNIAFGLVERKIPREEIQTRVADVLRRVGLEGLGDRMPGQLSGGQQQRVVLARALVLNPAIILLDEPLSNLDARLRNEMREEIEKLHRETDITFVYVTHDQAEALSLADRMSVMRDGRIHATGTPTDLYHRPPNLFCADFLGESNLVDGTVVGKDGTFLKVKTALGVLLATHTGSDSPYSEGRSIKCMIRPENLRMTDSRGVNDFEAGVVSLRLNGSTVTVVLETNGMNLKALALSEYPANVKPGMRARWRADPSNTIAIAGE